MEEGYRIPAIDEFIQGFEFEVVDWTVPTGIFFFNPKMGHLEHFKFQENKVWKPMQVTWMNDPNADVIEKIGDFTIHTKGSVLNFFQPFDVESYLKQGLIRVKI